MRCEMESGESRWTNRVEFQLRTDGLWSDGERLTPWTQCFHTLQPNSERPREPGLWTAAHFFYAEDKQSAVWLGVPANPRASSLRTSGCRASRTITALTSLRTRPGPEAARAPLGWGAYRLLVSWESGEPELERNPHYFGAPENQRL
jgi:hypothetical protein